MSYEQIFFPRRPTSSCRRGSRRLRRDLPPRLSRTRIPRCSIAAKSFLLLHKRAIGDHTRLKQLIFLSFCINTFFWRTIHNACFLQFPFNFSGDSERREQRRTQRRHRLQWSRRRRRRRRTQAPRGRDSRGRGKPPTHLRKPRWTAPRR